MLLLQNMNKINNLLGITTYSSLHYYRKSMLRLLIMVDNDKCGMSRPCSKSSFVSLLQISFNRHFNNCSYSTIFSVTVKLELECGSWDWTGLAKTTNKRKKKPSGLCMHNSCTVKGRTEFYQQEIFNIL